MSISFFLYLTLVNRLFMIAHTSSLSRPLVGGLPEAKALRTRQAPALIAASDFLRRGYQASVVAGDWIYIDGGEFSFLNSGTPQFQYASTLLSIDLSQSWTNATVVIQSTTKPDGAPNLNSPSLWYHESENLIYAGFAGWNSTFGDAPSLPPLSLWAFKPDGSGSGTWSEIIAAESSVWSQLTRPSQPLTAFGPENAWVLGGKTLEWNGWASPENLIPGMVQFNMTSRTFSNHTIQCCNATGGIYKGAMQQVPPFGPGGIHIAMGGQNGIGNDGVTAGLIDFGTVSIFDPTTQEWWNQTTTGSKPSPRVEFCTAGVSSTNGTYEIFVYAGWGTHLGTRAIQYDTINILTLPAFHWISVPYDPRNPRHGHSCNAVGGSQILTIGGVDSNSQITGGMIESIVESTFDSSADPFAQGLAIFDMTTLTFSNQFTARAPPYQQSEVVKQFYSQSNGAYLDNLTPEVSALVQVTHFTKSSSVSSTQSSSQPSSKSSIRAPSQTSSKSSYSPSHPSGSPTSESLQIPTLSPQSSSLKGGAIAGIAIGCSTVFLVIGAGITYQLRKRMKSPKSGTNATTQKPEYEGDAAVNLRYHPYQEMDGTGRPPELSAQGNSISELGNREWPVELQAVHSYH